MISAVNMSGVTVCNTSRSDDQVMDVRQCLFWELFSWSGARVAVFLTLYSASLTLSVAMNCYFLYLTLKHRHPRKPHYIILQNQVVCNMLIAITPCIYLLPNVLQGRTATLSFLSASFVGIMGSLLLAGQMTWALMAVERYIFVCHGLHYIRIVTGRHIYQALGVICAVVCLLNINYAVLIGRTWRANNEPSDGLLCDPSTFEKYAVLTSTDILQLHGPPSVIIVVTLVLILTCYLRMFCVAYKAALELRKSYRKAMSTVGFYLIMVLVQMLPMFCALVMVSLGAINRQVSHLLLVFLTTVPPLVNMAAPLYHIKKFRRSFLSHLLPVQVTEIKPRTRRLVVTEMIEFD